MTTCIRRLLKVVLHVSGLAPHQRRLQALIIIILSLASLAWLSQQLFNGVTVCSAVAHPSSESSLAVTQPSPPAAVQITRQLSTLESLSRRRLFVRLPSSSARLGNRMFAHAALLGLASDAGLQATVSFADDKNILRSKFHLRTPAVADTRTARLRTVKWPWRTAVYVPPPTNLTAGAADDEDLLIEGYFQSWRYFRAVDERVRAEFRFRKHIADAAAGVLRQLTDKYARLSADVVLVGVHVRRNDMALEHHRRRGYTVADEHYIRRAMNYVADRVTTESNSTLVFVVCTDDNGWARRNVRSSSYPVVFASSQFRQAEVDLAVLASCDHVITTVGTFSWWAGYLHHPDGITVYYAGFPKPGTEIGKNFHAEDFFPSWWIGML